MRFSLIVVSFLFLSVLTTVNAQSWLWNKSLNANSGIITPMKTIVEGDYVYTIAIFRASVEINGQTYISNGNYDMLILKYSKSGNVQWIKHYGSGGLDIIRGMKVLNGSVYITGSIGGTTSFDGVVLNNFDGEDPFVAKIGSDGTLQWSKLVGYGPGIDRGLGIDVGSGRIVVSCIMNDEISFFNSGTGVEDTFGEFGKGGGCLAMLDEGGNYVSGQSYVSAGALPYFFHVKILNSAIYMGGYYRDTLSFNDTSIVSNSRNFDVFVVKTNLDLKTSWFHSSGGVKNEYIFGMDIDNSGNIYLAGSYWSEYTFGTDVLTPVGLSDMLLISLDASGNPRWGKSFGDQNRQALYSVYVGDNLYVSGEFSGDFIFGSDNLSAHNTYNHQPFIGELDFNGNAVSAEQIVSSVDNDFNCANSLSQDVNGVLYVSGYNHSDSLYFGNQTVSKPVTGLRNGFIAKFGCPDTIGLESTPVSCVDGSGIPYSMDGTASVSYIEGGPYTYSWSNGGTSETITGLDEGIYTVTVSGGKCSLSASVYVGFLEHITSSITNIKEVSCSGWADGQATVTPALGNPPYAYIWSNGDTDSTAINLAVGTHTVTVSDQCGNMSVQSVDMTENSLVILSESTTCTPKKQCVGTASVVASGGTPPYSYLWNNGGATQTITNLCKGPYRVTVVDALGCQKDKDNIVVKFCALSETPVKNMEALDLNIYPNPATDIVTVSTRNGFSAGARIEVINKLGKALFHDTIEEDIYSGYDLNVDDYIPGIYYVRIIYNSMVETKKIVVQRQ